MKFLYGINLDCTYLVGALAFFINKGMSCQISIVVLDKMILFLHIFETSVFKNFEKNIQIQEMRKMFQFPNSEIVPVSKF